MQVAPFAMLRMLIVPVMMCFAGVLMFRNVFQPASEAAPEPMIASKQRSAH
jgi:hypothetical protein